MREIPVTEEVTLLCRAVPRAAAGIWPGMGGGGGGGSAGLDNDRRMTPRNLRNTPIHTRL